MVGSGVPKCPNCPHGRALTSLRTDDLVRNWEVACWQMKTKAVAANRRSCVPMVVNF